MIITLFVCARTYGVILEYLEQHDQVFLNNRDSVMMTLNKSKWRLYP